jgi:predicted component of type VI protein secretion system
MARPSPAVLDVMEHIADAISSLDVLLAAIDQFAPDKLAEQVVHARDELEKARNLGAEVLLEMLNLSERDELLQSQIAAIRENVH